jgi:broad specificity phosphatase PhoE
MAIVLVRHAAVEVDREQAPVLWQLSDAGRAGARALARSPVWREVQRIFCSPEWKAHETAQIIAGMNGIAVSVIEGLREVDRPARQWFDESYPGGYAGAVAEYFAAPHRATHGWEPPAVAQARIRTCIDTLRAWEPEPFAIAGHGLTLSLYLASLTGAVPLAFWPSIQFPDLAVVDAAGGKVLQPFGRWREDESWRRPLR